MTRRCLRTLMLLVALAGTGAATAQTVTVGAASTISDAPIYIAEKKGFFRAEGIEVKVINFRSAADMVAPLGTGQLDAGAGSAGASLYNAVARGIRIRIVADKASSPPGYGATKILVRKDLIDSGRYRVPRDLKGLRFAMNAPGVSNTSTLNTLLESAARLCEADKGQILQPTGKDGSYYSAASYRHTPEYEEHVKTRSLAPGRSSVTGRVLF